MGSASLLNACAGASGIVIPDSLKAPCVSEVDVSTAQTVGDLANAIIRQDAEIAICSARKDAVVSIAEAQSRPFWRVW